MRRQAAGIGIVIWACVAVGTATGQTPPNAAASRAILPPVPPWAGASRALIAQADDPWITPSEQSGLLHTPSYDETMAWLARLDAASVQVSIVQLGTSPEGRDLVLVVVSKRASRLRRRSPRTAGRRFSPRLASTPARSRAKTPG